MESSTGSGIVEMSQQPESVRDIGVRTSVRESSVLSERRFARAKLLLR